MKEELYVPILSTSGLTIDALVEFWAHVSAIAQIELDRIKQRAPASILKIMMIVLIFKFEYQIPNLKNR